MHVSVLDLTPSSPDRVTEWMRCRRLGDQFDKILPSDGTKIKTASVEEMLKPDLDSVTSCQQGDEE